MRRGGRDEKRAVGDKAASQKTVTKRSAARLARVVAGIAAVAAVVTSAPATQPVTDPYWIGDFRSGDYCQFATVFQSTTVNPSMSPRGYLPACPQYTPYARDSNQRVYLTHRPAPPAHVASRWVSHQELRTTDGPWFPNFSTAKSTIRLTTEQTMNGSFGMDTVRWFRMSFYLPNPGFNWPASSWYTLMDLHNSETDPAGNDWSTLELMVTPTSGNRRYIALALDGVAARTNYEEVRLLQLTKADGSRITATGKRPTRRGRRPAPRPLLPFNRWHTLALGVKFSDQGGIGSSPGWVTIYFDGKLVYAKARPNVWANETGVWLQLQNYKYQASAFVDGATSSIVNFADARLGYTLASVSRGD